MNSSIRYCFSELTLDVGRHELLRDVEAIPLSKLTFRMLLALVESAPNVVTHDELVAQVWGPRRIVTPENLAKRVMILRRALGDRAHAPRYVAGVRGVGYRLIPDVGIEPPAHAKRSAGSEAGFVPGRALRYLAAGLTLVCLGLIALAAARLGDSERAAGSGARAATFQDDASLTTGTTNVRINVELVDAETDSLIWTDSYEAELSSEDVLGIQDEIARSIAGNLGIVPAAGDIAGLGLFPMPM